MPLKIALVALVVALAAHAEPTGMKPWRLQAGAGVPFGLGLCAEYAPPLSIGFLKPAFELRGGTSPNINIKQDNAYDDHLVMTVKDYLDIGTGITNYIRDDRMGLYAGFAYDWTRLTFKADVPDKESTKPLPYTATTDLSYHSLHAKAGWRWMWGRCTLAAEAGYGLAFFDGSLDVTVESGGKTTIRPMDFLWKGSSNLGHGLIARLAAGVAL
ncbi:MAG: hypothetical protein GX639_09845 [Fibrobacter sp.]|nr:hypothetical protein [Fibrobacter sp.]